MLPGRPAIACVAFGSLYAYLRPPYFFEQPPHAFLKGSGEISVSVNFNIRDQKLFFARGSGKDCELGAMMKQLFTYSGCPALAAISGSPFSNVRER